MRILFKDLARTAKITSLYGTDTYPASNLADVFLDAPFVSALEFDTVTLDLGSDKSLDSIYLAECNAAFVTVELVNAALSVVYTGTKNVTRKTESIYTAAVSCRYVKVTADLSDGLSVWLADDDTTITTGPTGKWIAYTSGGYLKIKGLGCGVPKRYENILQTINIGATNETPYSRSVTGQVLRNDTPTFDSYQIQIPSLTYDAFNALRNSLKSFGTHAPTYFDFTEDTVNFTDPIYAEIPEVFTFERRDHDLYLVAIPLLEAR